MKNNNHLEKIPQQETGLRVTGWEGVAAMADEFDNGGTPPRSSSRADRLSD